MNERLRWWVLPGAVIVMLRVVTLDARDDAVDSRGTPVDASSDRLVAVFEGTGQRSAPIELSVGSALIVSVPMAFVGQQGDMIIWRRIGGVREESPCLELHPRVGAGGTLPIAGLVAGRYDVELRFAGAPVLGASDVGVPGTAEVRPVR